MGREAAELLGVIEKWVHQRDTKKGEERNRTEWLF